MPKSVRFEWHERVKAVAREYDIARLAVERLTGDVAAGDFVIRLPLRDRDLLATADQLEGTYTVRLYSVFEAALRSFWVTRSQTEPRAVDLIKSLTARLHVPDDWAKEVHEVREWRNQLVHDLDEPEERRGVIAPISLTNVRERLQKFLSRLPEEW